MWYNVYMLTNAQFLAYLKSIRAAMSPKALRVLRYMRDAEVAGNVEGAELIREGRKGWLDLRRVSNSIIDELVAACVVHTEENEGPIERYSINEDGREELKRRKM